MILRDWAGKTRFTAPNPEKEFILPRWPGGNFAMPKKGRLIALNAGFCAIFSGVTAAANGAVVPGAALGLCGAVTLASALAWPQLREANHRRPTSVRPTQATERQLGMLAGLSPGARVSECVVRGESPLGVLDDGQGFAAVLDLDPIAGAGLDIDALLRRVSMDPAKPSSVQIIIDQLTASSGPRSTTSRDATQKRMLVAVRYEPIRTPAPAAERGGGAKGAHQVVAVTALRTRGFLAEHGIRATPLSASALTDAVRLLGDPDPNGRAYANAWVTRHAAHCALASSPGTQQDWTLLLETVAATPAQRSVVAFSAEIVETGVRVETTIRLVAQENSRAAAACAVLLRTGMATSMSGRQRDGMRRTLPFGGPALELTEAIGMRRIH